MFTWGPGDHLRYPNAVSYAVASGHVLTASPPQEALRLKGSCGFWKNRGRRQPRDWALINGSDTGSAEHPGYNVRYRFQEGNLSMML